MKTLFVKFNRATWARAFLAIVVGLFVVTTVSDAAAAGRIKWSERVLNERLKKEAWYLKMEIHLPRAPDIAHKSMKFEFTQVAEFERALVDGRDEPQVHTIPLRNQQAIIESQIVGFMDAGSGSTQKRTRFSFKVTRAHGYRAGKWKVKVRDAESGNQIGSEVTLTFNGENPVIDRRSMVFTGKKKKKKEEPKEEAAPESAPQEEAAPESESASDAEADMMDEGEGEGAVPPSIEEKPGGGCHHTPEDSGGSPWLVLGLALAGVALIRRFA